MSSQYLAATTSQRQGRLREEGSEGSPRQSCEPTDRNVIRGRVLGASQHKMTKPYDPEDTVNGAVVQRMLTFLSGETCSTCGGLAMGAGLRTSWKQLASPPVPYGWCHSALGGDVHGDGAGVSRGHSSGGDVGGEAAVKGRTLRNEEEPWQLRRDDEPDRGSFYLAWTHAAILGC